LLGVAVAVLFKQIIKSEMVVLVAVAVVL